MKYEDIYSRSYMKKFDPKFYDDEDFAKECMKEWLHEIASIPYVSQAFESLTLDDDNEELTYKLYTSRNESSDDDFVKKIFSDGFVICWMRPKIDNIVNLQLIIGDSREKKIQNNYNENAARLEKLEIKLSKYIRDYGYNFDYLRKE